MGRFTELIDSFTFNATLSLVSLLVLADNLVSMIVARSVTPGGLMFLIWIVIAYHFISTTIRLYREKQAGNVD